VGICTCYVGFGADDCSQLLGTPVTLYTVGDIAAFNADLVVVQLAALLRQPASRLLVFREPEVATVVGVHRRRALQAPASGSAGEAAGAK
jgi:hypothetical protein